MKDGQICSDVQNNWNPREKALTQDSKPKEKE
jgi:hypothetical protein